MRYELVHEDEKHFKIRHPDGSTFPVAKNGLSPAHIKRIQGMRPVMMAEGGEVPDLSGGGSTPLPGPDTADQIVTDAQAEAPTPEPSLADPIAALAGIPNLASVSPDQSGGIKPASLEIPGPGASTPAPTQPDPSALSAAFPAAASGTDGSAFGAYGDAYNLSKQGIQGMAAAKSQEAQAQSKAYGDFLGANPTVDQLKQQVAQYDQHRQNIQGEMDQLQKDITNNKIDPNRVWNNKTTGGKISAAIGLVLGGIGSGLTGQPNQALEVLNKTIDRDIDAQKSELGKSQNLLTLNMQRYRDLGTAEAATRLQMGTTLQAQLAQAAARSGAPQAQAQAKMAIGQLQQQMIPYVQKLAMMRAQAQSLGAGNAQGGLSVGQEPVAMLSDPKYQEKRIVVNGRAFQAPSTDDAKDLRNLQANYEPVRNMVTQLDQLGPKAIVPGTRENLQATAIRAALIPKIMKMDGLNRLSEEDIKTFGNTLRDPTKFGQLMNGGVKNSQFLKNLNEDLESAYGTRLIGYRGMGSLKSRKPGWGT